MVVPLLSHKLSSLCIVRSTTKDRHAEILHILNLTSVTNTVIRLKPDNVNIVNAYLARALVKDELGYNSEAKKDVGIALQLAIEAGDANLKTKVEGFLRQLNE